MSGPPKSSPPRDYERLFSTEGVRQDLRRLTVRGGAASVANHVAKVALLVGSTVILARLLRPEDFGLVAMVTAFTGFSNMFRDFGLSAATVQREDVRHDQVSRLFWVNVCISAGLALGIAAVSPAIAWFYAQPLLIGVTIALAMSSLLDGLGIQHNAMMRRQMRFGALAALELTATAAGVVVSVIAAWAGAGYWALVVQQLVGLSTRTTLLWLVSGWRPGKAAPLREVRSLLAFGGHLTGSRTIAYFTRNLDKILIGKLWMEGPLGLYAKAINGIVLPFQQAGQTFSRVAVPTLSRLQDDPSKFRAYTKAAVLMFATAGLPAVAFVVVDAGNLVRLVLGRQWLETVPFIRVLAPAAFLEMVTMLTRWVFISSGQTPRLLRWRIFESSVKVVGLAAGVWWGPMGIATSVGVTSALLVLPAILYCTRSSPLELIDFTAPAWRPLIAVLAGAASLLTLHSLEAEAWSAGAALARDTPVFWIVYFGVWTLLPGGRAALGGLVRLVAELRPSRRQRPG